MYSLVKEVSACRFPSVSWACPTWASPRCSRPSRTKAVWQPTTPSPPSSPTSVSSPFPTIVWRSWPKIDHPAKIVPATVEFVDIAGLVAGASQGEGLGNQVPCEHPRNRCHLRGGALLQRPGRRARAMAAWTRSSDVETIKTELILADMGTLDKAHAASGEGSEARQGRCARSSRLRRRCSRASTRATAPAR